MKKVWEALIQRATMVMYGGFGITVIGVIIMYKFRYTGGTLKGTAFIIASVGLAIYIFGRVLGVISRRLEKKKDYFSKTDTGEQS